MWLLAAWLEGSAARRAVLAVFGTLALFYVHLLAAAVWVLVVCCLEIPVLPAALRHRRMPFAAAGAAVAGIVFLAMLAGSAAGGDSLPRGDGSNLWYPGHGRLVATFLWKTGIVRRMMSDHAAPWMAGLTLAGFAVFVACAAARGRPRWGVGIALAVGALGLGVLVLPESAGTGSLLDYRLALVPFLLAAAAMRFAWRSRGACGVAAAALLAVSLGRTAGFTSSFVREEAVIRAFEAAADRLPPESILLTAFGHDRAAVPDGVWWSPPTEHLAGRAVAHGVFVPTVFAVGSQQPVVLRPEYDAWRRTWQVRSAEELAAMAADVRPLCVRAAAGGPRVFLFVAYPGAFLDSVIDPADILASDPAFRLLNICAVPAFAS
jgi:hypothetical protein